MVLFCKSTSEGQWPGCGHFWVGGVFLLRGIASSALGLISFTLLLDRMLLRMSMVRLSRRAVGFQLSLCALRAAKYTLTLINIAFGLSDHRVHAVFWRGRI